MYSDVQTKIVATQVTKPIDFERILATVKRSKLYDAYSHSTTIKLLIYNINYADAKLTCLYDKSDSDFEQRGDEHFYEFATESLATYVFKNCATVNYVYDGNPVISKYPGLKMSGTGLARFRIQAESILYGTNIRTKGVMSQIFIC